MNVSPSAYYKWRNADTLENQKPEPIHQPQTTPPELIIKSLNFILTYPHWGGEKISRYLLKNQICYLSPATINRLKKRLWGSIDDKKLKIPVKYEFINPNDAWSMDFLEFKWGMYTLYILTNLEDNSRYLLNWNITTSPTLAMVAVLLKETFAIHGMPRVIKSDNGPQFREEFAAFLETMQIEHYPSPYYRASYNGKTERQNEELRFAARKATKAKTLEECVYMIGNSIYEYNYIRPHEALDGVTPYERFSGSEEQVKGSVRIFKEKERRRRKKEHWKGKLLLPGQPDPMESQKNLALLGRDDNKSKGIIVPVKSQNHTGKNIGRVRQTIHF